MKPYPSLLLCLLMLSCAGSRTVTPIQRYLLSPEIQVQSASPTKLTLGLRPLKSARPYSLPMLYRGDGFRLQTRDLHEWAEQPASAVTRALTDALAATARFADVGDAAEMPRPDLILTGELRQFYENRLRERPAAELELRLVLRARHQSAAIWSDIVRAQVFMDGAEAQDFAAAMNRAIADAASRVASAIAGLNIELDKETSSEEPTEANNAALYQSD